MNKVIGKFELVSSVPSPPVLLRMISAYHKAQRHLRHRARARIESRLAAALVKTRVLFCRSYDHITKSVKYLE